MPQQLEYLSQTSWSQCGRLASKSQTDSAPSPGSTATGIQHPRWCSWGQSQPWPGLGHCFRRLSIDLARSRAASRWTGPLGGGFRILVHLHVVLHFLSYLPPPPHDWSVLGPLQKQAGLSAQVKRSLGLAGLAAPPARFRSELLSVGRTEELRPGRVRTRPVWLRHRQGLSDGTGPFGFLGGCQSTHGTPFQHLVFQGKGGGAGSDGSGLHPLVTPARGGVCPWLLRSAPCSHCIRVPQPCVKPRRSWPDPVQPYSQDGLHRSPGPRPTTVPLATDVPAPPCVSLIPQPPSAQSPKPLHLRSPCLDSPPWAPLTCLPHELAWVMPLSPLSRWTVSHSESLSISRQQGLCCPHWLCDGAWPPGGALRLCVGGAGQGWGVVGATGVWAVKGHQAKCHLEMPAPGRTSVPTIHCSGLGELRGVNQQPFGLC